MTFLRAVLFFILGSLPAAEAGKRVYDFAGILPEVTKQELTNLLTDVERQTTAQFAVVTVSSLEGETVDEYANKLSNAWGIGSSGTNNGVLFLIAPNERRARIEVGFGLEPLLTDSLCGAILDDFVIPRFKASDYSGGITAGAKEIARILKAYPDAAKGVEGSAPYYVQTPSRDAKLLFKAALFAAFGFFGFGLFAARQKIYSSMMYLIGSLGLGVVGAGAIASALSVPSAEKPLGLVAGTGGSVLLALIYNFRKYMRFGPHGCEKCGTRLVLFDEAKDNEKLSETQQLEEQLGSVDYDVWVCPACLVTDTKRYVSWFSGFKGCPSCKAQTFKETETVVRSATRYSTGLARINGACVSCKHAATRTRVIPRITQSSSGSSRGGSSGGGFGGGSSGGGGASRGW